MPQPIDSASVVLHSSSVPFIGNSLAFANTLTECPEITGAGRELISNTSFINLCASAPILTPPHTILDAFNRQVALGPERIALSHHAGHINYRQLDAFSNQIARWIAARAGALLDGLRQPLIPLALPQGPERIATLLAILKLGGAYVPIEPKYPAARIRQMLDGIDARLLITEASLAPHLLATLDPKTRSLEVLSIDMERSAIDAKDIKPIDSNINGESACYVMYTSGSTGAPKGVVIPHRGVVRLCVDTNYMHVRPDHCFAQLANIAFDAATWEIWGALLNGARLALLDTNTALSTEALGQAIRDHGITHLFLTTALCNQHIATNPMIFAPLDYMLFGGEAASVAMVRRLFAANARPKHILNVYGPTENTTYSTTYEITESPRGDTVPIGKAIAGSSCYVVHEQEGRLVLAPPGTRGELLVGGLGLALGYHNDAETTRAKFVECTFSPGERLYRTGDVVDLLPSGDLVFLGRTDNQVKLRGFRIELEEIELALAAHPQINAAAVLIENGSSETKQLVAYLVGAAFPDVSELRVFLKERIPEFMIPSVFIRVDAFPLGVTGKIDRRRLAEIPHEVLKNSGDWIGPRTVMEHKIHGLWAATTGIALKDLDVRADFFELGGNSLLAARLAAELREAIGVDIAVHDVFRERTIERLAAHCDTQIYRGARLTAIKIPRIDSDRQLPLSFAQEQIWLHQQLAPQAIFYNEPLDITIPEELDITAFGRAFDFLIERHEALRAQIEIVDGVPTQRIMPHEHRPLPLVDLRHLPRQLADFEAQQRAEELAQRPFDLAIEPLFRALLVRLANDAFRLFMVGHHLVFDGVTMFQIFLPELEAAYRAFALEIAPSLPPLSLRFRDFIFWQRASISKDLHQKWSRQETYWKHKLAGAQPLILPIDHPRDSHPSFAGARRCFTLSQSLSASLRELASRNATTLFATLLAAFKALLFQYSQQHDLTVATVVSNRAIPGLERVVGDFLNTVLLRTEIPRGGTFLDLLAIVERTCIEALENGDVPFQRVAGHIALNKSEDRQGPIRAAFVLEPPVVASEAGWTLGQHAVHTNTAKFDLTFELDERPFGILARVEYRSDLFEAETITRMIRQFEQLLQSIVENPRAPLTESRQLPLADWQKNDLPRLPERNAITLEPRTDIEKRLYPIFSSVLGIERLGIQDDFFHIGGDSILGMRIVSLAVAEKLRLEIRDLLEARTIEALAQRLQAGHFMEQPLRTHSAPNPEESDELIGSCPLSPIQAWFFAHEFVVPHHFNQAFVFEATRRLDPELFEAALHALVQHHDTLRLRYEPSGTQRYLRRNDESAYPHIEQIAVATDAELSAHAERRQRSLDIYNGPVIAATIFTMGSAQKVWICIHHLLVDGVSWRILMNDLGVIYEQLEQGRPISLPPKSCSFRRFVNTLEDFANQSARAQIDFWQSQLSDEKPGLERMTGAQSIKRSILSPELTTELLQSTGRVYQADIKTLLLAALHKTLISSQRRAFTVWLEGHGREPLHEQIDLTRSIGWFTSVFPVRFSDAIPETPKALISSTRNVLASIPQHGLGYLALRYLSKAPEVSELLRPPFGIEILFNYLGQLDTKESEGILRFTDLDAGRCVSEQNHHLSALEINAVVIGGALRIEWAFVSGTYSEEEMEALAVQYLENLTGLILHSRNEITPARTLIRFRTSGKHAPFFLVHPAGGSAFGYREIADTLGPEHPVYGLDAPDSYEGHNIASMAASYIQAMQSVQPQGPYFLGGWSLGGMIAFEMAQQLEQGGQSVALLVLLDARPHSHENQRVYLEHMVHDDAAILSLMARHLGVLSAKKLAISYQELSQMGRTERESWFYQQLVAQEIFPEEAVEHFVKKFVKNFRLVNALFQGYAEVQINADILLLRASTISQHYEGFPALEEPLLPNMDDSYGWKQLTRGTTRVRLVPGTHEDLIFAPHAAPLAEVLGAELKLVTNR